MPSQSFMPSKTDAGAARAQVRLRLRRWLAVLAPDAPPVRRSARRRAALRRALAESASATSPIERRRAITASLRRALLDAAEDRRDPFGALAATAIGTLQAWEGDRAVDEALAGWDALLTVLEVRPSFFGDGALEMQAAFARAARAEGLEGARRRLESALLARVEALGPGDYLRRLGARTPEDAVRLFWTRVEGAFLAVSPPEEHAERAATALGNLLRWDTHLTEIRRRIASGGGGEEAAQATAARFLEPAVVAAWAWLPADALYRVAQTCGRHAHLATLTGPVAEPTVAARVPDPTPDAEAGLGAAERWQRFFGGLSAALDSEAVAPWELVFLWLSAGVGAGEAWRTSGGPLERVGSANYARNRLLERLRAHIGGAQAPQRLSQPGAPDPRSRALLGLLTMRDAPDPSIEEGAGVPTDARSTTPPLDDRALLALLYLLNLGPEAARAAAPAGLPRPDDALLARSLAHVGWARRRRAALVDRLDEMSSGPAATRPADDARLADAEVVFLLAAMVTGLPSEAARRLSDRPLDRGALDRWLAAEGPAHEVITRLRGARREALPPPPPLPRRPVERDAHLRLYLRGATDG